MSKETNHVDDSANCQRRPLVVLFGMSSKPKQYMYGVLLRAPSDLLNRHGSALSFPFFILIFGLIVASSGL